MSVRKNLSVGAVVGLLAAVVIAGCATASAPDPHAGHGGWGDRPGDDMPMKCSMAAEDATSAATAASAPGGMKHCMAGMAGHGSHDGAASAPLAASGVHAGH